MDDAGELPQAEHLAWCKRRALEYVEAGKLIDGVTSMLSDLAKHQDTACGSYGALLGMMAACTGNATAVRRWIESFN